MTWRCKINGYTHIFGLKKTDKLYGTVYDGDLWRRFRDRQNAMARARRRLEKMKYNGELKLLIYMFILMILIAVLLGWYNGVLK